MKLDIELVQEALTDMVADTRETKETRYIPLKAPDGRTLTISTMDISTMATVPTPVGVDVRSPVELAERLSDVVGEPFIEGTEDGRVCLAAILIEVVGNSFDRDYRAYNHDDGKVWLVSGDVVIAVESDSGK